MEIRVARPPLAAGAQQIEHRVNDAAQLKLLWVSGLFAWRDERPQNGPLFIGQVGWVRMRIHPAEVAMLS
jgi:hypothetical protein